MTQARHRVLLVDDDQELLDLYQDILSQLPSRPQIATSLSGARAMAMLEADPYTVIVCDLNMPKMDGLQVLSIVRRKYPGMRTVVLTSVMDEQFRSRVYGLGVDLFWQKPGSGEEIRQFLDCMESLLGRDEQQSGFRGVQSKSLVDIIQLECISHNSTVLRIVNGRLIGKIWIQDGDIIDAVTEDRNGEAAFHIILSWKAGSFESLAAEPDHPRVINNSYQGLLLETAQAQDEALGAIAANGENHAPQSVVQTPETASASTLSAAVRFEGVEFVLALDPDAPRGFEARGLENPKPVAEWSRQTLDNLRSLGERLQAGTLQECECLGPQRNLALARQQNKDLCVGWQRDFSASEISESMKKVLALWVS